MIITLTTDFGLSDHFVGVMKGVILSIAPQAQMVDLAHGIPAHDILAGALSLEASYNYFPEGTIHVAVVDPGVGSERSAIAVKTERYYFIAPDNGLLDLVLRAEKPQKIVKLTNPKYRLSSVSATFHGRDIFAPAAAHVASGVPLEAMGELTGELTHLPIPAPKRIGEALEIHVLCADHFGNLITDLTRSEYDRWNQEGRKVSISCGKLEIHGVSCTYAQVPQGQALAYFGSGGRLEIAVREGRACDVLPHGAGNQALLIATEL
jgi:S-adenosyl-L-methionine hydrolase (adenosine-forming)